mmetsp:Transcript_38138/g.95700  ORF Transcript_38138/g.95700 Transcript_38138/m.95700 type:complete len:112 (+) Transcript_38138:286-621(+)
MVLQWRLLWQLSPPLRQQCRLGARCLLSLGFALEATTLISIVPPVVRADRRYLGGLPCVGGSVVVVPVAAVATTVLEAVATATVLAGAVLAAVAVATVLGGAVVVSVAGPR